MLLVPGVAYILISMATLFMSSLVDDKGIEKSSQLVPKERPSSPVDYLRNLPMLKFT